MTKYHEAGKGGDQRPTDHKKFSSGYDLIWGKKKDDDAALTSNPSGTLQRVICERCGKRVTVSKLDPYVGIHTCTPKENQSV